MKRKRQIRFKPPLKRSRSGDDHGRKVRRLTAQGYTGDEVAQLIGVNKNRLRAAHALDFRHGRELARAQAEAAVTEELSADEETMRRAIFAGFGNPRWTDAAGRNLLHNYRTREEQEKLWAEWLRRSRAGQRVLPIILEQELFPSRA